MPELVGVLAVNDGLQKATRLEFEGDMVGPEAFAVDKNGTNHTHVPACPLLTTLLQLKSYCTTKLSLLLAVRHTVIQYFNIRKCS